MILTTAIAAVAMSFAPATAGNDLSCAVMGSSVAGKQANVQYNGVTYAFCCAGCDKMFIKEPQKFLKNEENKGKTFGTSMFDPVTGLKVDLKKAKNFSDFDGTRYYFASVDNKTAFDKEPKKYGKLPEKEALFCPIMGHEVKSYGESGGYVDHAGVRYYVCCEGCMAPMKKEAAKYVDSAKGAVKAPAASIIPAKK